MENWTNTLLCQTDNTNFACKWPPMCLPDEPTITQREQPVVKPVARSRDYPSGKFAPKRKSVSADAEKANKSSDRAYLREKLRIPSVNLRPIQLVFFWPFYRSSTLTSRSSTLSTLIFPWKKHILMKRMVRVPKIIWNIKNLSLARALTILIISKVLSCHSFFLVCSSTVSVDLEFTYVI